MPKSIKVNKEAAVIKSGGNDIQLWLEAVGPLAEDGAPEWLDISIYRMDSLAEPGKLLKRIVYKPDNS